MRLILDLDETLLDTLERQYFLLCDILAIHECSFQKESYLQLKKQGLSNKEILLLNEIDPLTINAIHSEYLQFIESKEYLKLDSIIVNFESLKMLAKKNELHLCSMRSSPFNSEEQLYFLNIKSMFKSISWVPHNEIRGKIPAVSNIKEKFGSIDYYIGDSDVDRLAAESNEIRFLHCNRYSEESNFESLLSNYLI